MRNPLGAIVQCADTMISSLARARNELTKTQPGIEALTELIDTDMDAVETIILCAQHQRRIIDDVLTLSKLDANMLLITPIDFQPLYVIKDVLKMFRGEAKKHNIQMDLHVDESYQACNINWVRLDPSRLTQVLVNILGNAIKFTRASSKRRISVTISASVQKPLDTGQGIEYIPAQTPIELKSEPSHEVDGDSSKEVYLHYSVQDTGRGLTSNEMQKLFKRFGQGEHTAFPLCQVSSHPV